MKIFSLLFSVLSVFSTAAYADAFPHTSKLCYFESLGYSVRLEPNRSAPASFIYAESKWNPMEVIGLTNDPYHDIHYVHYHTKTAGGAHFDLQISFWDYVTLSVKKANGQKIEENRRLSTECTDVEE